MAAVSGVEKVSVERMGMKLLEGLTSDLYQNAEFVLREYVSNGIDAGASEIHISCFYPTYDYILIRDNGVGMSRMNLKRTIGSIAVSDSAEVLGKIGRHGVGIYSAFASCERIEIRTKSIESEKVAVAFIPVAEWRELLDQGVELKIGAVSDLFEEENTNPDLDHFTEIRLVNPTDRVIDQMFGKERDRVPLPQFIASLERSLPVIYDPTNTLLDEVVRFIQQYEDAYIIGKIVSVNFNGNELYRRFNARADGDLERIKITYDNMLVGIGWIRSISAKTRGSDEPKAKKSIKLQDAECGLQIRHLQVTILDKGMGDNSFISQIYKKEVSDVQPTYLSWLTGEVLLFDIDPKYKFEPTHARNNFKETNIWESIRADIAHIYQNSTRDVRRDHENRRKRAKEKVTQSETEEGSLTLTTPVKVKTMKKKSSKPKKKDDSEQGTLEEFYRFSGEAIDIPELERKKEEITEEQLPEKEILLKKMRQFLTNDQNEVLAALLSILIEELPSSQLISTIMKKIEERLSRLRI